MALNIDVYVLLVSILSDATPHLNLANALRCENGKAILQ
jgi:hypothetical protein